MLAVIAGVIISGFIVVVFSLFFFSGKNFSSRTSRNDVNLGCPVQLRHVCGPPISILAVVVFQKTRSKGESIFFLQPNQMEKMTTREDCFDCVSLCALVCCVFLRRYRRYSKGEMNGQGRRGSAPSAAPRHLYIGTTNRKAEPREEATAAPAEEDRSRGIRCGWLIVFMSGGAYKTREKRGSK